MCGKIVTQSSLSISSANFNRLFPENSDLLTTLGLLLLEVLDKVYVFDKVYVLSHFWLNLVASSVRANIVQINDCDMKNMLFRIFEDLCRLFPQRNGLMLQSIWFQFESYHMLVWSGGAGYTWSVGRLLHCDMSHGNEVYRNVQVFFSTKLIELRAHCRQGTNQGHSKC